jgi:hypothetical protein
VFKSRTGLIVFNSKPTFAIKGVIPWKWASNFSLQKRLESLRLHRFLRETRS